MRLYICVFGLLFCTFLSKGQEGLDRSPQSAINTYFEAPRETMYAHLNKSTYLTGEEIWFKAYAYDRKNNLPSPFTTNYNIEIYNSKGEEVYSGLFLGYQGSAKGNIAIDKSWSSGTYYFRLSTNWMNNFVKEDFYTQEIRIINKSSSQKPNTNKTTYDFQLLPEGGHIVAGTENTIGFKLINNLGHGVSFKNGFVVDNQNTRKISFGSNRFGIGKFILNPQPNQNYTALVVLDNGQKVEASFPEIKKKGISISINNLYEDNVVIGFNTNETTLKQLKNKKYYLLIHQLGVSKKINIDFSSTQFKTGIFIKRNQLYPGVNTLTLFENDTPILERLLFNSMNEKKHDIQVVYQGKKNDSLLFNLIAPKTKEETYDLSISVLPQGTKSYNHQDNIASALLLRPYLKGFIEEPKYYFTNKSRKTDYDLDLLLLTQGWSKYNWDVVFNTPPKIAYSFNNGLTIKGKVQNVKNKSFKQAYVYPTTNNSSRLVDLDSTNSFIIENYYPNKGEFVNISTVNNRGKFSKTGVYIQTYRNRLKKPINLPDFADEPEHKNGVFIPSYFFDDVELLDEVLIQGRKKEKEDVSEFLIGKSRKIDETDARVYQNIANYIEQVLGIRLNLEGITAGDPTAVQPLNALTNNNLLAIYLDDIQLIDFSTLLNVFTRDVENVYYDRSGFGGNSGEIRIYSKKTLFEETESKGINTKISAHTFKNGFNTIKEYYNPLYTSYQDPLFKGYGTIHWQPQVIFNAQGVGRIKIPDTSLKNITFFIEGMRSDGSLISKTHTVTHQNKQ